MLHRLKKAVKGSQLSIIQTLCYTLKRGGSASMRGAMWLAVRGRYKAFPLFLGRNVTIYGENKLILGKSCVIGDFSWINAISTGGLILGDRVTLREFAWIQLSSSLSNLGHGLTVAQDTYIGPRCYLGAAAPITIGRGCLIGGNVQMIAEQHRFDETAPIAEQGVTRLGIRIGDNCWIGNGAIVLDGVVLGEGCVVGAGAVVTKSFPAYSVIVGVPAKATRLRDHDL